MSYMNKAFAQSDVAISDDLISALANIPQTAIPYMSTMNQHVNSTANIGAGIFSANDGSAAAPSFTFKSDPNTGIYSGGANAVATTTNGTVRTIVSDSTTQLNNILECHNDLRIGTGPYVMSSKFDGSGNYFTGNVAIGSTSVGTNALEVTGNIMTTAGIKTNSNQNCLYGDTTGQLLSATGIKNVGIGHLSFVNCTSGSFNTVVGASSGAKITDDHNTLIGGFSGSNIVDGSGNTCSGFNTGNSITSGTLNTIIGCASDVATGSATNAIALGYGVSVATNEIKIGNTAHTKTTFNTFGSTFLNSTVESTGTTSGALIVRGGVGIIKNLNVGGNANITKLELPGTVQYSVSSVSSVFNINDDTAGFPIAQMYNENTLLGQKAGGTNTTATGTYNTGCGYYSLGALNSTTGNGNSCFGARSGRALTTGIENTFLGKDAGSNHKSGTNNILLGVLTQTSSNSASNEIVIGNSTNTTALFNNTGLNTFTGAVSILDTTATVSTTSGALIIAGGVGIMKSLRIGSTTETTSTSSGALIVSGGVGIAKALNVGGTGSFPFGVFGGTKNYTSATTVPTSIFTPSSFGITRPIGLHLVTAIANLPTVYACGIATCTNSTTVNAVTKICSSANSDLTISGNGLVVGNATATTLTFTINFTPI